VSLIAATLALPVLWLLSQPSNRFRYTVCMIRKRKSDDMVTPMQMQSSGSSPASSSSTLRRLPVYLTAAGGALVLFLFLIMSRQSPPEEEARSSGMKTSSTDVIKDTVGGVEYYHCSAQQDDALDLVLLHGAHFTKKNWKKSGILEKLCNVPELSVTALDLNHRGNHDDLKNVLDDLRKNAVIQSKPVALVTPSASGYTIVDWITTGKIDDLVKYVGYWIPVASPSIGSAKESNLEGLKGRLPILAIYGSDDKGGKKVSDKLESFSDAKLVEINGGHPCYLDSPDDFIKELLSFLK